MWSGSSQSSHDGDEGEEEEELSIEIPSPTIALPSYRDLVFLLSGTPQLSTPSELRVNHPLDNCDISKFKFISLTHPKTSTTYRQEPSLILRQTRSVWVR